jgi:hypothetical protein
MQVPDEVRKCVCFIVFRKEGDWHLAGTAFFLGEPVGPVEPGTPAYGWGATVTARHVIDGINGVSDDGKVYLRLNDRGKDSSRVVETDIGDWIAHPGGPSVDVAVLPWVPPIADYDHLTYTLSHAVDDELAREENISVGDEVFISGLFVRQPGKERNTPIVRIGNIAALPGEPINTRLGDMRAYLVESRSTGGLSGSPVFVNLGPVRQTPSRPLFTHDRVAIYLLGLMHGHWDVVITDQEVEAINMGIAIVPPIASVLEVLSERQEFKDMKQRAEENARREGVGPA